MADSASDAHQVPAPGAIARAIARGEAQAETWLVTRYRRPILILLRNWGHSRAVADDLAQEALLVVLQRLRDRALDDPDQLSAFVHSTARQIGANATRTERRRTEILEREYPGELTNPATPELWMDAVHMRRALLLALAKVRLPRDRSILYEHYVQGTPKAELCNRLGLSAANFDRVLYNARSRLRAELRRMGFQGASQANSAANQDIDLTAALREALE
jgi:RNA polymerase sigma factor (sigma-70 family)